MIALAIKTAADAYLLADKFGLKEEVKDLIENHDYDPISALAEWDLI